MGFEFSHGAQVKLNGSNDHKPKRVVRAMHNRCKSDPSTIVQEDSLDLTSQAPALGRSKPLSCKDMGSQSNSPKKPSRNNGIEGSLKKEILQLEKRLQDQFVVRQALEKALGYRSLTVDTANHNSMPKPTKELIKEIAVLELEVLYLEKHLLTLYRKAYDQQSCPLSPLVEDKHEPEPSCQSKISSKSIQTSLSFKKEKNDDEPTNKEALPPNPHKVVSREVNTNSCSDRPNASAVMRCYSELSQSSVRSAMASLDEASVSGYCEKLSGNGVYRCHSALSQNAINSALLSPHDESEADMFFSQPLAIHKNGKNGPPQIISLAECLGTRISDHVPETPNRLSEDLVRCMGSLYCKLAEPALVYPGTAFSPSTSFSSLSAVSPQYLGDMWSPNKDISFDSRLENPFRLEGLKEISGPYNAMIEVTSVCRDAQRIADVDDVLKSFKSLMHKLEKTDIRKMLNDEKLAFWINIHNALVMHAYIKYGIPQNHLKRMALFIKATFNIGGRMINADTIQSCILGHRSNRPGQWVRTLLSPKSKSKSRARDGWQTYAIEHPEPLLHFALCSGSHSDPTVRIYTPKRVFQQLETAKQEYIRAAISIRREQKILLPKILDSYSKESNLSLANLIDMIQRCLPQTLQMAIQRCQVGRSLKCIEWVPHNFEFRYLMSRELTSPLIN